MKAKSTAPTTPKQASPAPAAKKKPRTKKAANAGGAAAEADQQGSAPAAKPKPEKARVSFADLPKPKYGRSEANGNFDAWIKGCPEGRSDLQQPKLEDNEARWEFGKHTATGKEPVTRTLPATLVMPSLSGGKDFRFKATGSDIGEDIILPDGTVERRNCTIKSVCHHKQLNESAILLKAKADSKKFVLASPDVQRKFAHLNHLEHTEEYVNSLYGSFSDVAANNQPKNYFWVRGGWLKEFGEGPIALWMEEAGKVQLKIYVLCSSERNSSKLESLVTHILARQGHAYWLKWDDGLEALKDLLVVAPYLYRYVDTSIEPCVYLDDTLKARKPIVPKFLTAKASFQTMIETGQQLGACPKWGSGAAGEAQTNKQLGARHGFGSGSAFNTPAYPPDMAQYCTSCKHTKHKAEFKGKTCKRCLDTRKAKYVPIKVQTSRYEEQAECNSALSAAITEATGECAWLIESLCWELVGKDSASHLQEANTWIMKVHRSLSKLTTELSIPLRTQLLIVTSTGDALDALKQIFTELAAIAQATPSLHAPITAPRIVAASIIMQALKHSLSVKLDKLGFAAIPKPLTGPSQARRIESDTCLSIMQQQGASHLELERARLTGVFGFFCCCPHNNTDGGCEQIVQVPGTRCIRCSGGIQLLWFTNAAECRCYCSHCLGGSESDSGDEEQVSISGIGPATPKGGCKCRDYVLGAGWTTCTGTALDGSNWCARCWDAKCSNRSGPCTASAEHLSLLTEPQASPVELSAEAKEALARRKHGVNPYPKLGGCSKEPDSNRIPRQGTNLMAANFNEPAIHALQLTLPAVSFSLEEMLETHSNGSAVWMNGEDSHQAIRNVVRKLNHWYYSNQAFSDGSDLDSSDLLIELVQLTNIRHWQSLVEHIARLWYNTAMSCRAVLTQVGHWKWAVNKLLADWRSPIRSTQCATLTPTVAHWIRRIEYFRTVTFKHYSACEFPDLNFNSNYPSPHCAFECPRDFREYVTIECFQSYALKTQSEETIIEVWAKMGEMSADREHHITITAAINEAWHCHEDPDGRVSDAIDKLRQLTLLNNFVYLDQEPEELEKAKSIGKQLMELFESGSALVLAGGPQCGSQSPVAAKDKVWTYHRSISPSSSFERFSPIRCEQRGDNADWVFDFSLLSPSLPVAMQRNYDLSSLTQLRQSRNRWNTSEEEAAWDNRILDRFPKAKYRVSHRYKQQPTRLAMSVSHSSMDTVVSPSVSPDGYSEAAGLSMKQRQRVPAQWVPHPHSIPAHLRMPTQVETNKTFDRVRQTKLLWPTSRMAKEANTHATEVCLLCSQDFATTVCKHNLDERKKFCSQCWADSRAKCKEMLGPALTATAQDCHALIIFNNEMSVLTEQTPNGGQALPVISMIHWSEEASKFTTKLGLECSSLLKLMHPEGSSYRPNTPWVLATVDFESSRGQPPSSLPRWNWVPNECATDELRLIDGQRIESSVGYLREAEDRMNTPAEPRPQPRAQSSGSDSSDSSEESSYDSDSARLDRRNGNYCNCPKGCRVELLPTEDRFCDDCCVDTDGKVHCSCDCTTCHGDPVFRVFGVNETELNRTLAEELEHPASTAIKHKQSSTTETHKTKFAPVLQQLLQDMHYFENLRELTHGALTYAQIQPWRLCSCPHCFQCPFNVAAGPLQTRLHTWCDGCCDLACECCDELEQLATAAEATEAGTNSTQLSEAQEQQQAVGFSLDHFSKHCIGKDVSESGMETSTPVARNTISNAKWAGCQWPKKYVESQMHICNNQTVAQSGGLNRTTEGGKSSEVKFSLTHFSKHYSDSEGEAQPSMQGHAQVTGLSDYPSLACAAQQPTQLMSDDSLKQLVFTDYSGRTVWNHFNQKSFLEFEIGIIHEISRHLPTRTEGFDQIMETICRYTHNCYWKGSSHPFIGYILSKPELPRQTIPIRIRTAEPFANALQSHKAFDLTDHPDSPQSHHVVITAKLRNRRSVTVYYFKVEPTSRIDTLKKVIEAEEGLNAHHQRWYSSITGKEANPGPFDAARVGDDESLNGMAYYLQQGELYLRMSNHNKKNWVSPASRKPNEAKRLMRKPDATWSCRRYKPFEPELPSGNDANRMNWSYAADTPKWATATVTQLLGTKAISEPRWATAIDLTQYFH